MPALSPDGKRIAFVWRGDIWVAAVNPAHPIRAYPVTNHVELDAYPLFSPDGRWLAFSSLRNGNWDIFVVPAEGGETRQITLSSGSEIATDWSPDGKAILFAGERDSPYYGVFTLDLSSRRFHRLTEDYRSLANPVLSPDGKKLAFQREGRNFPWTRPRYLGSQAAQLWTLDLPTGVRKEIDANQRQHLWPRFTADGRGILTVTTGEATANAQYLNRPPLKLEDSPSRTPNLWLYPTGGGTPQQITRFTGDGVRCPTVARQSGEVAFEYGQDIYLLPTKSREPVKLTFLCGADEKENTRARQVFTNQEVSEAEISPDGKTFAFAIRGDLWTIPVDKPKNDRNAEDAVRLTDNPGFDHDFNWSKDSKTLYYVSDRQGNEGIFALEVATKAIRPIWAGDKPARGPRLSPDGKLLGFWVAGPIGAASGGPGGLYIAPTDGSTPPRRIAAIPAAAQGEFSFSPDSQWIALTRRNRESYAYNIHILPVDGSREAVNVTRLNASHRLPTWSPDGKYLFFISDREDGLGVSGTAAYVLPLQEEEAREDELVMHYEKPGAPLKITIAFEDIPQRIRRFPVTPAPSADLAITDSGALFFTAGGDAYTTSFDGKETRKLTSTGGISNLRVSEDGKTIFYYRNGGLYSGKTAPPYPQTPITFAATWERDLRAERSAAFLQFWRAFNNGFYDPNFHGRDWNALRARYEPQLDAVGTRYEFATLLNRMIGEVEASHSEVGAAPAPNPGPVSRNLGVYFDYSYSGPGIRVKEVPRHAPGWYPRTRIKPGEYILEVDGKPVSLTETLYEVLNDKGNRDFVLLVNDRPEKMGARTVTYKALSDGEWDQIHYQNRIDRRRKMVEELSGGTLAYVHIAGMGSNNQVRFEKELYEYAEGKKGLIIDVRENGGGSIADNLLNWLAIKPYRIRFSRDDYPVNSVDQSFFVREVHLWNKPIVVLMNESSLSNAEIFPSVMRENGLARLVGMPTPGYVISTGGLPLVDGTRARMPSGANFRKDGSPMENLGEKPDILVPYPTEDYLSGRDPQLQKAIEILAK